jgi:outer membrane lipoprotein-sorting protein
MKKNIFISLIVAFVAISISSAQDLDNILDKHFETIGQKKLLKVKTVQATGKAVMMGMDSPFKMVSKRPNKILVTVEFQGAKIIQAYDGETAWMINPMMGSAEPMDVTGPEADGLIESGDLDGQLWNYKEKGHTLELEGTEEVDGAEAYVLKLTKKNGNIDYYYMETESYLILKIKSKTIMNGSETEAEALLSNYQEVNGYVMAFTIEQKYGGQTAMTIMMDEVETNVEVDDSIFSKPAGN